MPARLRARLERALGRKLGSFLRLQGAELGDAYGVGGIYRVGVSIANSIPALGGLLEASYRVGIATQAAARAEMLGLPEPSYIEPHVVAYAAQQSAARVVDINDATVRRIQGVVTAATAEAQTLAETARAIRDALVGASRARSFAIARTEVGSATAFGDHLAAKESGLKLLKQWLTAGDGGKRHPSYPGLNGQTREIDEPFDVGGAAMQFPLDPDGPAEEVVNCRCVLNYLPRGKQ